jgi:hypothetical protein
MDEDKGLMKILKWAGLAALIAIPLVVILKKQNKSQRKDSLEDESNIFATELEE